MIQRALAHPRWALGVGDAVGWSRLAQPTPHGGIAAGAKRTWQARTRPKADPAPQALACYGLLVRHPSPSTAQLWRRCVTGRPVRAGTIDLRAWGSARTATHGFTALVLIGDHASWHRSNAVRRWLRQHHQQVKQGAVGARLVVCPWPSKSPWLNPIEPKGGHGKRAASAADRLLRADELEARVYAYDGCEPEAHLMMPKKVA